MGLLNYLGGRGSSAGGEGSSRHVESDVVTVGGVALEEEKSWEQPDPSVDNVPFTSFDEARPSDSRRRSSAADRDNVVDALERDFDVTIPVEGRPLVIRPRLDPDLCLDYGRDRLSRHLGRSRGGPARADKLWRQDDSTAQHSDRSVGMVRTSVSRSNAGDHCLRGRHRLQC